MFSVLRASAFLHVLVLTAGLCVVVSGCRAAQLAPAAPAASASSFTPWPGDRTAISFLFGTRKTDDDLPKPNGGKRTPLVDLRWATWFGPRGELETVGGAGITDNETQAAILAATAQQGRFVFGLTALGDPLPQADLPTAGAVPSATAARCLFGFGAPGAAPLVALVQVGEEMRLQLGSASAAIGRMPAGTPMRWLVALTMPRASSPGRIQIWNDGKPVLVPQLALPAAPWTGLLSLGNDSDLALPWHGQIVGAVIRHDAFDDAAAAREAAACHARLIEGQERIVPALVRATVIKRDRVNLKAIATYRRSVLEQDFRIDAVLAGTFSEKEVRVRRYFRFDHRNTGEVFDLPEGATAILRLVPFIEGANGDEVEGAIGDGPLGDQYYFDRRGYPLRATTTEEPPAPADAP